MCNFFLTSYSKPLTRSPNFFGKLALKRGKQLNIWVPDINNCEIHFYKFEKSDIKGLQDIIPFIENSDNGKTADKEISVVDVFIEEQVLKMNINCIWGSKKWELSQRAIVVLIDSLYLPNSWDSHDRECLLMHANFSKIYSNIVKHVGSFWKGPYH